MTAGKKNVAVLISGRGSNLEALIDACADPRFPARIVTVVSNRPNAGGLEKARRAGVSAHVIDHTAYPSREAFETALHAHLQDVGVDIVCLAGFMRLLTGDFVGRWGDRMLNIHPSLLPLFKGLDTHARALEAGVRFHGCTVHVVRPDMDAGPIIGQAVLAVGPDDTPETLAGRILGLEHRLYPLALRAVAEGRVRIVGDGTVVEGGLTPDGTLMNPDGCL